MEKSGKKWNYDKYNLNDTDKNILTLKLEKKTNTDIAKKLKLKPKYISNVVNKPEFKKAYNELSSEIQKSHIETLLNARKEASDIYISLMRNIDTPIIVKARICEYLLRFNEYELQDGSNNDNGREFKGWNDNNA